MTETTAPSTEATVNPPSWKTAKIDWTFGPFAIIHLLCFAAIWTGVTWQWVAAAVGLYYVRMFFVTGFYHRYFSHRSFKTSRFMQFIMAFCAQTTAQKGALWWAAHHRHHHRHSDSVNDTHSPAQSGLSYAHIGWIIDGRNDETNAKLIPDLMKYPELRFLDKWYWLPAAMLGVACYLIGSWEGLVVGFFWSTVALWHGTFTINSFTHVWGKKDFPSGDDSKNSMLFALITCGEGWHNNHHFYQNSCRQGFYWWQIDITYYLIRLMGLFGLVWDIKEPPAKILEQRGNFEGEVRIGEKKAAKNKDNDEKEEQHAAA